MSKANDDAKAGATAANRAKYYLCSVIEEFDSKRDAEAYLSEKDIASDEVILKGKEVEPQTAVRL